MHEEAVQGWLAGLFQTVFVINCQSADESVTFGQMTSNSKLALLFQDALWYLLRTSELSFTAGARLISSRNARSHLSPLNHIPRPISLPSAGYNTLLSLT